MSDTFAVTNPATGETLDELPRMGAVETARAIDSTAGVNDSITICRR